MHGHPPEHFIDSNVTVITNSALGKRLPRAESAGVHQSKRDLWLGFYLDGLLEATYGDVVPMEYACHFGAPLGVKST